MKSTGEKGLCLDCLPPVRASSAPCPRVRRPCQRGELRRVSAGDAVRPARALPKRACTTTVDSALRRFGRFSVWALCKSRDPYDIHKMFRWVVTLAIRGAGSLPSPRGKVCPEGTAQKKSELASESAETAKRAVSSHSTRMIRLRIG